MPKVEVYLDDKIYMKILDKKAIWNSKTNGETAATVIKAYFTFESEQDEAVRRFTEAMVKRDERINNLQYELNMLKKEV